ncbi:MAG: hypothetical protein AAB802_02745 [Patescibacteria group bacterium]
MSAEHLHDALDLGLEDFPSGEGLAEPAKKIKLEPNVAAINYEAGILRGALDLMKREPVEAEAIAARELLNLEIAHVRELLARETDDVTYRNSRIVSTRSRQPRAIT